MHVAHLWQFSCSIWRECLAATMVAITLVGAGVIGGVVVKVAEQSIGSVFKARCFAWFWKRCRRNLLVRQVGGALGILPEEFPETAEVPLFLALVESREVREGAEILDCLEFLELWGSDSVLWVLCVLWVSAEWAASNPRPAITAAAPLCVCVCVD